ncbi:uncharacterized protein LOC143237799 [Tachypleus tridentatus]|uniref:uncharacterized protein LOC143237799 n=1 Tax=Tachypleus tridentatus TaxID=6853 RepID=UPI003FD0CCF6
MLAIYQLGQRRGEENRAQHGKEKDIRRPGRTFKEMAVQNRNAAACAILLCIYCSGLALVMSGIAVTCVGILLPDFRDNRTPWIVIGPTLIVIGVLVLLLSIEIIIKLRKVAPSDDSESQAESHRKPKRKPNSWNQHVGSQKASGQESCKPPTTNFNRMKQPTIIIEPATPILLDPSSLAT